MSFSFREPPVEGDAHNRDDRGHILAIAENHLTYLVAGAISAAKHSNLPNGAINFVNGSRSLGRRQRTTRPNSRNSVLLGLFAQDIQMPRRGTLLVYVASGKGKGLVVYQDMLMCTMLTQCQLLQISRQRRLASSYQSM